MKRLLKRIEYAYGMQNPEVRIFLLLITTIAAVGILAMVVNFFYYGI